MNFEKFKGLFTFAKAMPLIAGGLAGFVLPPGQGSSVAENLLKGDISEAGKSAIYSYTGLNNQGQLDLKIAVGLKGIAVGAFVSAILSAIVD